MVEFNVYYLFCGLFPLGRFPLIFRNIKILCIDFYGENPVISILSEPVVRGTIYTVSLTVTLYKDRAEVSLVVPTLPPELELEIRGLQEYFRTTYPVCIRRYVR